MAKAYVNCQTCRETIRIPTKKNSRDADRYATWLEDQGYECQDCKNKAIHQANEQAAKENQKAGFPNLTGSEKQTPWAEKLRATRIQAINQHVDNINYKKLIPEAKSDYGYLLNAKENIEQQTQASWWIDQRDTPLDRLLKTHTEQAKKADKQHQEDKSESVIQAKAEATICPEDSTSELPVEILHENNSIKVKYPIKNETLREIVKDLGLTWATTHWNKTLSITDEKPQDRIAELGSHLLNAGFPVIIWDHKTRTNAITANYQPLHTRWINADKERQKFLIKWKYGEDYYREAKRITRSRYSKPYIEVPEDHYEEVQDFAEQYDFKLSPSAFTLIQQQEKAKAKRLKAHPQAPKTNETEKPEGFTKLQIRNENVNQDLLDD